MKVKTLSSHKLANTFPASEAYHFGSDDRIPAFKPVYLSNNMIQVLSCQLARLALKAHFKMSRAEEAINSYQSIPLYSGVCPPVESERLKIVS